MARDIAEYEASLIGALLVDPSKMAEAMAAGVRADWFELDRWSLMWSALEAFWKRGEIESASAVAVRAEAQRLAAAEKESRDAALLTVAEVSKAIDSAGIGQLGATIRLLRNRRMEVALHQAVQKEFGRLETWADYADGVRELRGRLDKILIDSIEAEKIPPRAMFGEIMAEYNEAHQMRVAETGPRDLTWTPGIKMPWPKVTQMMNGLRAGLHVVAARPSVGKTAYAINLMRFWCEHGTPVLFVSLDMPRREVMRRFVAEVARVSARKAAFSPTAGDLAAMDRAVEKMNSWPLSVVETRDVDDLRTLAMIERSASRLGVIVVDYLQLMHAKALGREDAVEYARVSYVSDTLKRIANELHTPVVALAQLNREVTKQESQGRLPGLSDLRGSGSIEQDAYTVTILHRDQGCVEKWRSGLGGANARRLIAAPEGASGYSYNFDDLDPVWWILCKAQNGPTGRLPFLVRKKYFCWMLADYEAKPITQTVGHGATARETCDYSPLFERVHGDWRKDGLEATLRLHGALIDGDAEKVESPDAGAV